MNVYFGARKNKPQKVLMGPSYLGRGKRTNAPFGLYFLGFSISLLKFERRYKCSCELCIQNAYTTSTHQAISSHLRYDMGCNTTNI